MAKTTKKTTKEKAPKTQKKMVPTLSDDDYDDPILVNEKNEIIYNPDDEIKRIMESTDFNIAENLLDDDVKEGLEYIKTLGQVANELPNDYAAASEFVETKIEEINEIKEKLNTNKKNVSTFDFSTFWNGVTY